MQKIKHFWERYKQRGPVSIFWDAVLLTVLVLLVIPDGRVWVQRGLIQTGIFGSTKANEKQALDASTLNWQLADLNGNRFVLADFSDKPLFLNFWATWCAPCRAEMPSILSLMEQTGGEAHFVLVTYDPPEKVRAFLENHGWDLPVYFPLQNAPPELEASSLPTTLVINTANEIIHRSEGMRNWGSKKAVELVIGEDSREQEF
ncbi:MAG: TlpA family protein disulfide reductase [Cryomorphaceae bacterium]|nr:MAG: TlpA family protein disulfide reductase [Cryomorphaceae bacterium]